MNGRVHPIERNNYLILTKPIERVIQSVVMWLRLNFPGTMIYGGRRLGKSHCAEFIRLYLAPSLSYNIAVALLCVRKHDVTREVDFLDELLECLRVEVPKRASKTKKMTLIVNRFLVLARRCPVHKVVLVLDDAQRLENLHFEILMSLQNQLYQVHRVTLFTLMVGQPQLKKKRDLLIAKGEKQITGRLMADDLEFVGQRTLEEVEFAFGRLDDHCFFPAKSGISFTQGLAPEAWAANWRLRKEAPAIYTEYQRQREARGIEPVEEMPMAALTTMATYVYRVYAIQPGFTGLTPAQVEDVVESAGMLQLDAPGANDPDNQGDDGGSENADRDSEDDD